jgi:hypothetical protein
MRIKTEPYIIDKVTDFTPVFDVTGVICSA